MGNKQTAVDFLEESIRLHCLINDSEDVMIDYNTLDKLFMKARAMEKEQIKSDFHNSVVAMAMGKIMSPEQYYNETYGKE